MGRQILSTIAAFTPCPAELEKMICIMAARIAVFHGPVPLTACAVGKEQRSAWVKAPKQKSRKP
ncbi:MAG: hypothetical protein ACTS6O_07745, partial [Giesbergeria sp.]